MGSQPGLGEIELLVLATLAPAGDTLTTVAERLEQPPETIAAALVGLVQAGMVEATDGSVTLTEAGRLAATDILESWPTPVAGTLVSSIDLSEVARLIGSLWPAHAERAAAEETARAELLASDADRDTVVGLLSDAFSQGRLSSSELEQRTSSALSARTYGELDDVLQGLGGLRRPAARSHPVRKALFWVVALFSSPFVLMGTMLFAFGDDVDDHVAGVVFLVLLLPGLFALRRWAWPRS